MRLTRAILLSLALHFIFGTTAEVLSPLFVPAAKKQRLVSVDLVENMPKKITAQERKAQQLVRAAPVPKNILDPDKEAKRRFESEDRQTVLEETRAADTGLTTNRSPSPSLPKIQQPRKFSEALKMDPIKRAAQDRAHLRAFKNGDMGLAGLDESRPNRSDGESRTAKPLAFPDLASLPFERGESATGEKLPDDIKIGRFTALNTDRYLYYSFYSRAEELFRHHWEKYVRAALYTFQQTHRVQGNETWDTRLEILLDPQGRFLKAIIRESCGLRSLDLAPAQAFQDAARIPNPPPEMVKEDGAIHMMYEFFVEFVPQYASSSN